MIKSKANAQNYESSVEIAEGIYAKKSAVIYLTLFNWTMNIGRSTSLMLPVTVFRLRWWQFPFFNIYSPRATA
jgi:hypothetical protein